MSICPASNVAFSKSTTSTDYFLKSYSASPPFTSLPPSDNIIKADGSVNTVVLTAWVDSLVNNMAKPPNTIEPDEDRNPTQTYASKAAVLRENMKAEYCYYYSRYMWSLEKILTDATTSGSVVDPALKSGAESLNRKLNTILLVMKQLVNSRSNTLNMYYNDTNKGVNHLNRDLDQARTNLAKHSMMLQNNDLKSDVQSAMIDYSLEKNSSSRNLLAIYGFMNIVAAGLLFYVYTKSKA